MNFGLLSDNFGADFVSFWMKFTVTVNFLLLLLKCLNYNCFMLQSQKLSVKCYRGTPIQTLLKPSSPACSRGHGFISVSNAFLVINLFLNMWFFSDSLNKKRMNGRSKLFGKKMGPHQLS